VEYVIKEWFVDETPNSEGVYVRIKGREGGMISFLLSWVGIDPTVTMIVDKENIRFEKGSWSGFFRRITPMDKLCASGYGYQKPWKSALVMALIGFPMIGLFGLGLLLIIGAVVYYYLNKQLRVEFSEIGGYTDGIAFKRSVIEGIKVDEADAARVIRILEALMQGKAPQREEDSLATTLSPVQKSFANPTPSPESIAPIDRTSATGLFCPECGAKNSGSLAVCASCGASLT
jgi:hypothetical protein